LFVFAALSFVFDLYEWLFQMQNHFSLPKLVFNNRWTFCKVIKWWYFFYLAYVIVLSYCYVLSLTWIINTKEYSITNYSLFTQYKRTTIRHSTVLPANSRVTRVTPGSLLFLLVRISAEVLRIPHYPVELVKLGASGFWGTIFEIWVSMWNLRVPALARSTGHSFGYCTLVVCASPRNATTCVRKLWRL